MDVERILCEGCGPSFIQLSIYGKLQRTKIPRRFGMRLFFQLSYSNPACDHALRSPGTRMIVKGNAAESVNDKQSDPQGFGLYEREPAPRLNHRRRRSGCRCQNALKFLEAGQVIVEVADPLLKPGENTSCGAGGCKKTGRAVRQCQVPGSRLF